jgi:hypothetical protein
VEWVERWVEWVEWVEWVADLGDSAWGVGWLSLVRWFWDNPFRPCRSACFAPITHIRVRVSFTSQILIMSQLSLHTTQGSVLVSCLIPSRSLGSKAPIVRLQELRSGAGLLRRAASERGATGPPSLADLLGVGQQVQSPTTEERTGDGGMP